MMTVAVIVDFKTKSKPIAGIRTVIVDNTTDNRGFAAGVNIGIKKALAMGAKKVLLVNPDLKIGDKRNIREIGYIGDIGGPVLWFRRNGKDVFDFGGKVNWFLGRTYHVEAGSSNQESGEIEYVSGACMVVDRKVFEKIGFFDERFFMYFEDVDFCLRAKQAGFKVAVNPKIIVEHQIEEHRHFDNPLKKKYLLDSNRKFVEKWISPMFIPLTAIYLALLSRK